MLSTIAKSPTRHHRRTRHQQHNSSVANHNIIETENSFVIELAVPGFDKENFEIRWDHDKLIVAFTRPEEVKKDTYVRKAFIYENFERAFTVKSHLVETESIHAEYQQGILRVTLPKSNEGLNLVRSIAVD